MLRYGPRQVTPELLTSIALRDAVIACETADLDTIVASGGWAVCCAVTLLPEARTWPEYVEADQAWQAARIAQVWRPPSESIDVLAAMLGQRLLALARRMRQASSDVVALAARESEFSERST